MHVLTKSDDAQVHVGSSPLNAHIDNLKAKYELHVEFWKWLHLRQADGCYQLQTARECWSEIW